MISLLAIGVHRPDDATIGSAEGRPMSERPLQSSQLFITAVEAIYDAATAPSLWPQALQSIADVTGDVGAVMVYGRDDGLFGFIHSPESRQYGCRLS